MARVPHAETCPTCGGELRVAAAHRRKRPGTQKWLPYEVVVCESDEHAWWRWRDDPDAPWTDEPDYVLRRRYRGISRANLKAQFIALVAEIGAWPTHSSDTMDSLTRRVIDELPTLAPSHPNTQEAVAMATFWRRYGR